jgi:hypothetical protein
MPEPTNDSATPIAAAETLALRDLSTALRLMLSEYPD